MIHHGSWGNEVGRPEEEWIGNLLVRDIAFYRTKNLSEILEVEKPEAVIFLSTDTFLHRAFNRYCRYHNIPTINLFHAIRGILDADTDRPFKMSYVAYLRYAFSKLPRALRYVWPAYSVALWKTGAGFSEWVRFVGDIVRGVRGIVPRVVADDARTDRCCVYIEADVDFAISTYGFPPKDVVAVGNPDLIRFGLSSSMIGSSLPQPLATCVDVMYADAALIATGFVFGSEDSFVEHVVDVKNQLARQGKHLLFKPHPGHFGTHILPALEQAGVEICSNEDFVSRLQGCCACIVEPSSIAVFAALLGTPLFLARFGALNGQEFGALLTQYPRAKAIFDISDFNSLLASAQADRDTEKTIQWIERNAGPLPAERMPERVAEVCAALVEGKGREAPKLLGAKSNPEFNSSGR